LNYRLETPTLDQAQLVADLINDHELTIDPESTPIGITEARELLEGFFDPSVAAFLYKEDQELPAAFFSINPDKNRKRLFTDVYSRTGSGLLREVLEETLKAAYKKAPDYEQWFGVNTKDKDFKQVLESFGMRVIRTYWNMRLPLEGLSKTQQINQAVSIRLIDNQADMEIFWKLNQDAFSKHFGFAPREKAEWIKMTLEASTYDPMGCFLLDYEGEPAGFVQLANANYHLNGGFVDLIGVAHSFQGKGLGQILLEHAINVSIEQGREFLELNVDTGNESGALRLYEKLGFKPNSAWEQYENKKWAEIAKGL
jgi:ribosomal protein S18 acetylase RimI-like enzyme